jgi:hypothetical protein
MYLSRQQVDSSADNVYFNAVMAGPTNTIDFNARTTTEAEFAATRTVAILPNCSDYYCSIVRFTIPLDLIPILIMPIIPGSDLYLPLPAAPRNITPFIIGIKYNNVNYVQNIVANNFTGVGGPDYSANMIWTPEDYSIGTNRAPLFQDSFVTDRISAYLYMYWYDTFITMINASLALAYAAFVAANPAAPQAIAAVAPFFYFDPVTQLISLVTHNSWATTIAQFFPDPINVARVDFNAELGIYLDGFKSLMTPGVPLLPSPTIPPQDEVEVVVENLGYNGYPVNTYPAVPTYLKTTQNYNVITAWNSLRKLVITTNTIPIVAEAVPTNNQNNGVAASLPIISDFVPQLTSAGDSRTIAYYNPTAQYRIVDMQQNQPLQKVDLKVFWEDKDNNLYPLLINKYNQASIKVGFFKKSLYKHMAM